MTPESAGQTTSSDPEYLERLEKYKVAVSQGVAFLDTEVPGWEDHIDLDRLSIEDYHDCIVGQLAAELLHTTLGDRTEAIRHFYNVMRTYNLDPIQHGFDAHATAPTKEGYEELELEWERVIEKRLAEKGKLL